MNRSLLSADSASRTTNIRLIELQFVKDQIDRQQLTLSAAARAMVDAIRSLNHSNTTLGEISQSIASLISAVSSEADE